MYLQLPMVELALNDMGILNYNYMRLSNRHIFFILMFLFCSVLVASIHLSLNMLLSIYLRRRRCMVHLYSSSNLVNEFLDIRKILSFLHTWPSHNIFLKDYHDVYYRHSLEDSLLNPE